jgi:transcriptional regulator with XRE-family HTH domain
MRQADLAEAAGVSRYTIIKLELGQLADINLKTLLAILAPLGLELRLAAARPTGLPVLGELE